jgi:hypothetical protein
VPANQSYDVNSRDFLRILAGACALGGGVNACVGLARAPDLPPRPVVQLSGPEHAAMESALREVAQHFSDRGVVCVSVIDSAVFDPDSALLASAAVHSRAVRTGQCPRTYGGGVALAGATRPPRGYVDPHVLEVHRPRRTGTGWVVIITETQGTRYSTYRCEIRPDTPPIIRWTGRGSGTLVS